jgi:polyhydroxyalkanoate synthesis regulator phasin
MSSKKRIAAVVVTVAALSLGSIGVASAHGKGAAKTKILAELVKAGTITQVQSDAISKKFDDVKVAMESKRAERDARRAAVETLVATTIGVDAATIKSRLAAGETLAAIAGAKKDALISALVAHATKEIDARVAAGKMTAAQATAAKADLTKKVTSRVESTKGPKGFGPKDHKAGKGKGARA